MATGSKREMDEKHDFKVINSPLGDLTLIASPTRLLAILWENDQPGRVKLLKVREAQNHPILIKTQKQLEEYFVGKRRGFDLPIQFTGTEFQNKVWSSLQKIPYGQTLSYGVLAKQIGSPKACRAVGAANGRNPMSIVVPCHRVIGSNGTLTGFAGGLERKRILLELEAANKSLKKTSTKNFGRNDS